MKEIAMTPASAWDDDCATRLQLALTRGDLGLFYQPKLHLLTGAVTGVEAVARWHDPELGTVSPAEFIPVAERKGLIDELTQWVLQSAVSQWVAWRDQGIETHIAVNVSALNLRDLYLPDYIQRLCMREGMPCDRLTIEVTESATQNVVRLLDTLTRFRLKGFRVSLDDFGTGYSSLLQLRQLPYSELKIDQCFVQDMRSSTEARTIVKALIDLAHGMGLVATAEGVEDITTLEMLRAHGCDEAQGFLIARPMAPDRLPEWLMNFSSPGPAANEVHRRQDQIALVFSNQAVA
jgi:EAL domain-containing protein (putative c-di-GMP-specific phosphodiesterase class I)